MLLPFSDRAKPWEYKAHALRRLVRASPEALVDPAELALKVGLRVVEASFALQGLPQEKVEYLLHKMGNAWSGGVLPSELPDGTRICILNPKHSRRRNKVTLMEEISHVHLGHIPSTLKVVANGLHVRDYDHEQEHEAYGVGAAVLIPWLTFFPAVNAGSSIAELSEQFDVTADLIAYRLKITAAYKLYRSRQALRFRKAAGGSA